MNTVKTAMLLAFLTAILLMAGGAIGGRGGATVALIFAGVMNFGAYWFSDKVVLRMYRAKEVSPSDTPQLHGIVRDLTMKAKLPMPKVYIMDNPTPNAFATGRNPHHAAVAVTTGIVDILSKEELTGVIGHELAHIQNRDILVSTIAATIAGRHQLSGLYGTVGNDIRRWQKGRQGWRQPHCPNLNDDRCPPRGHDCSYGHLSHERVRRR